MTFWTLSSDIHSGHRRGDSITLKKRPAEVNTDRAERLIAVEYLVLPYFGSRPS
jgi:hypothetical protein